MPDYKMSLLVPGKTLITERWYALASIGDVITEERTHLLAVGEIVVLQETFQLNIFGGLKRVFERFVSYSRKIAAIGNTGIDVHLQGVFANGFDPSEAYLSWYSQDFTVNIQKVPNVGGSIGSVDGAYDETYPAYADLFGYTGCGEYDFGLRAEGWVDTYRNVNNLGGVELIVSKITMSKWEVLFRDATAVPADTDCDGIDDDGGPIDPPPPPTEPPVPEGSYRGIECDSPRLWLHVANGKKVDTLHTLPGSSAFVGAPQEVEYWKQLRAQSKEGVLFGLGRSGGASKVFASRDGGQTFAEELKSVDCYSGVIEYDSERRLLMFWTEESPPDPVPAGYQGAVTLYASRDSGVTWDDPVSVQYASADLEARLLGSTYEPRNGAEVFLLVKIGGDTKILNSNDGGRSFELRFE